MFYFEDNLTQPPGEDHKEKFQLQDVADSKHPEQQKPASINQETPDQILERIRKLM